MRISSKLLLTALLVTGTAFAAPEARETREASSALQAMKLARRFGIGFSAGGSLAVLGVEADVNLTKDFSLGLGVGTGLDYQTVMLKGRYFLLGEWVSPFLGVSVARWWSDGTTATGIGPGILSDQFLGAGYDLTQGFSVFLLSPSIGVQFMHPMGFAISAELQYLFRLFDFSNGAYAGMAAHWYF